MKLFDVYPLFQIEPIKGSGAYIYDKEGIEYLDFYGGHAVISVGHSHPYYVEKISAQLNQIGFYSNSVLNSLQKELADKLGALSGYDDHQLFLCNSGAEAVENALKMASFKNGKNKFIAFKKAFHGRTSGALQVTDNPKIRAPFNLNPSIVHLSFGDLNAVENKLNTGEISGIIIEGIQGIAGIVDPGKEFLQGLRALCDKYNVVLIIDEVQSGYGRTGNFFAHQQAEIKADIVTIAKGMGNGFPIGGVLIGPEFEASNGLLGTTFGGSHLACAAGIAVLDIIKDQKLIDNAKELGTYLKEEIKQLPGIEKITGRGLMLGVLVKENGKELRSKLLHEHKIFTGSAGNPNILRLLPPLNITKSECDKIITALKEELK
ncbi:MAG: acetylornithine/N-succinyldiaminopimelate aminotransferase [Glaciecola sp.]|jgi:acetylornithine/N-succinyldiaminopimelate aminotransferase